MCLIILTGDAFAGCEDLAAELRDMAGFRVIDDQVLIEWAAARGEAHRDLLAALAAPPGPLDGLRRRRAACRSLLAAGLAEESARGPSVYYGNAGYLLREAPVRVARVRVFAPLGWRIAAACRRLVLSRTEAGALIRKMDRAQRRRARRAGPWDLHVHLGEVDCEQACRQIAAAAARPNERAAALQPNWRRQALAAAACLSLAVAFARPGIGVRTLTGTITDTHCGAGHAAGENGLQAECVRACVRGDVGVAYALYAGRRLYVLNDRRAPEPFAARRVSVTGSVDRFGLIRVRSIEPQAPQFGHVPQ